MASCCRKCLDHVPARYVLALWMFLGMVNVYILRNNVSVAIVAMVNSTGEVADRYSDECSSGNETVDQVDQDGDFFWSSVLQSLLLGAYYYGYALTQIVGGWMEIRFGGRVMFGTSVFLASVLTILNPPAAQLDFWAIFTMRFLIGFVQGVVFPTHHGMWGRWAPPLERSQLMSFSCSGTNIGTVIASIISGVIASSLGWEYVYYITGCIGLVWVLFWFLIIHSTPDSHPRITDEEKSFIKESIGSDVYGKTENRPVPWKAIFKSIRMWGLLIGHFCSNWGNYTLLTSLPTYMDQVLGFDLSATGFLSALPSLGIWLFTILSGWIADLLRKYELLSTLAVRRLFTVLGMFFPAIFLIGAGFIGCNDALIIAFITISASFSGCAVSGFKVNHVEIAPSFGGILFGITNTVASIPGFVAPTVVGVLTEDENTRERWFIVFAISAVIYVVGGVIVLATLTTEVQDWAKEDTKMIDKSNQDNNNMNSDYGVDNDIELYETIQGKPDTAD